MNNRTIPIKPITTMNIEVEAYIERQNNIYNDSEKTKSALTTTEGKSYIKVIRILGNGQCMVHSFIAVKDIHTRSIIAKKGDILKPAGWSCPAKHARGSIFEPTSYNNVGTHGPHHL